MMSFDLGHAILAIAVIVLHLCQRAKMRALDRDVWVQITRLANIADDILKITDRTTALVNEDRTRISNHAQVLRVLADKLEAWEKTY